MANVIGKIIEYESGNLEPNEVIELFSELVKSGLAWSLQGSYGRMAAGLIENGYINRQGEILREAE